MTSIKYLSLQKVTFATAKKEVEGELASLNMQINKVSSTFIQMVKSSKNFE